VPKYGISFKQKNKGGDEMIINKKVLQLKEVIPKNLPDDNPFAYLCVRKDKTVAFNGFLLVEIDNPSQTKEHAYVTEGKFNNSKEVLLDLETINKAEKLLPSNSRVYLTDHIVVGKEDGKAVLRHTDPYNRCEIRQAYPVYVKYPDTDKCFYDKSKCDTVVILNIASLKTIIKIIDKVKDKDSKPELKLYIPEDTSLPLMFEYKINDEQTLRGIIG